jgi:2-polyprenyl-3-methyl-5-hydroxy-6-metoxy-1,4-benzoquinol methylase
VDEFHLRAREATLEPAGRTGSEAGMRLLDVGCSIGVSACHLAAEHGCHVTGIDLTSDYIEVTNALAEWTRLTSRKVSISPGQNMCR